MPGRVVRRVARGRPASTLTVVRGHRGEPVPDTSRGTTGCSCWAARWARTTTSAARGCRRRRRADRPTRCATGAPPSRHLPRAPAGRRRARWQRRQEPSRAGRRAHRGRAHGSRPLRPVAQLLGVGRQAVQWNDDIVTRLPAAASVLAVAPDGSVQAARFGARAWGVQFHPEVSPESSTGGPSTARSGRAAAATVSTSTRGGERRGRLARVQALGGRSRSVSPGSYVWLSGARRRSPR